MESWRRVLFLFIDFSEKSTEYGSAFNRGEGEVSRGEIGSELSQRLEVWGGNFSIP